MYYISVIIGVSPWWAASSTSPRVFVNLVDASFMLITLNRIDHAIRIKTNKKKKKLVASMRHYLKLYLFLFFKS